MGLKFAMSEVGLLIFDELMSHDACHFSNIDGKRAGHIAGGFVHFEKSMTSVDQVQFIGESRLFKLSAANAFCDWHERHRNSGVNPELVITTRRATIFAFPFMPFKYYITYGCGRVLERRQVNSEEILKLWKNPQ